MQKHSILLSTLNAKYIHMNLAIRLLYELNKKDERLTWKEFTIKEDLDQVAEFCSEFEVVCFSCYIWNITQTMQVAEKIKRINSSTKILLGGPEVTYDWQEIIQSPNIDYIITGEGEIPFSNFLSSYPNIDSVSNLISKKNSDLLFHKHAENFDLALYESTNPYQNEDPATLYNRVLYIETSRGCPYKCEFCLASLDNKVRYLPIAHIKQNLLYLMNHGRVIKFLDRTFNVKKDFTLDIFQFILDHARPENVFQFEITADILHPDIISFIKEKIPKGMFRFEIGIQTVNQKSNLEVGRKQVFEKTKRVIEELRDYVEMHLDLIVGLPFDYWSDIKYSFEAVFKLYPPELQLGFLKFLKGTPVRDKHEQHGYVFDPIAPYQIIRSNYLSEEELAYILKLENALEIYWNKKRLVNTLKYVTVHYSVFDFLLGLGKYFEEHSDVLSYGLKDVYNMAYEYILSEYPDDHVIRELLAIDYYLQHKIKPSAKYLNEIDRKEKFALLDRQRLPHNRFRYVVIQISFDYQEFIENNLILSSSEILIIEYSGQSKPSIISTFSGILREG
jgi:anaerobic magnesium-protoporphyrin IX monomethyl ester cyclase